MKNILTIALILIAFAANAQTPAAKETAKATTSVNVSNDSQAPVAAPVENNETPAAPTAVGAPDNSAYMVGTNDLNILLLRQGVKRA